MANYKKNTNRILACDYSGSYAAIYDSPYGISFVFVDEDDSEEMEYSYIPSLPSSHSHFSTDTIAQA